jgi:hypothetical protein
MREGVPWDWKWVSNSLCGWVRETLHWFSWLFSTVEPYGLQEDDERDNERENTGRKKKVKIKIIF